MIASHEDGIYYNLTDNYVVDLDETFRISGVNKVIHDSEERCFYMLCNSYKSDTGIFLVKFDEKEPTKFKFFLNWHNNLEISDAYVAIIRSKT